MKLRHLIPGLFIPFILMASPWKIEKLPALSEQASGNLIQRSIDSQPLPQGVPDINDPLVKAYLHDFNQEEMIKTLHSLVNEFRLENGKNLLTVDPTISFYSQRQSDWMAVGRYPLGHQDANLRYRAIHESIPHVVCGGENVARIGLNHTDPVSAAFSGWIMGPGHRAHILGDFTLCGYGISKTSSGSYYFTHFFVKTEIPCEEDAPLRKDHSSL